MAKLFGAESKLRQLDSCCCGVPLRFATLVIGWLSFAAGIWAMVAFYGVITVNPITGEPIERWTTFHDDGRRVENVAFSNSALLAQTRLMLLGLLVVIISAFSLIVGVYKKKAKCFVPFMTIMVGVALLGCIIIVIAALYRTRADDLVAIFVMFFIVLFDFYLLAVVHSYYRLILHHEMVMSLPVKNPPAANPEFSPAFLLTFGAEAKI